MLSAGLKPRVSQCSVNSPPPKHWKAAEDTASPTPLPLPYMSIENRSWATTVVCSQHAPDLWLHLPTPAGLTRGQVAKDGMFVCTQASKYGRDWPSQEEEVAGTAGFCPQQRQGASAQIAQGLELRAHLGKGSAWSDYMDEAAKAIPVAACSLIIF